MLKKSVFTLFLLGCLLAVQAQNVNVSGALVGNGSYPTLTSAFAAINGGAQTGTNITISIVLDTYEGTGSATLNAGTWNRITIAPVGAPRTIQGATTPGQALIDLNGADRVLFNGLLAGQKALTLVNTTVASLPGTATVRLDNAAQYNRIHDCKVQGSSLVQAYVEGGTVLFAGTTTTGGNSYNCLRRCEIGPAPGGLPIVAVFSKGSSSVSNVADSLVDCDVHDYFDAISQSAGLRVHPGNLNWRVLDNHFYQTASRTKTAAFIHADILFDGFGENEGHTIKGNFLGGTNSAGTGMATYHLSGGAKYYPLVLATGTNIGTIRAEYNTITHIRVNASAVSNVAVPFSAVYLGGRADFQYNVIGSTTSAGVIEVNVLNGALGYVSLIECTDYITSFLADNMIGGAAINGTGQGNITFDCINAYDTHGEMAWLLRNQIGFAGAPITVSAGGSASQVIGIRTYSDNVVVDGNTIAYIQSDAPMAGNSAWENFMGIRAASQFYYGSNVRDNHVHSLTNTHPSAQVKLLGIFAENVFQLSRNFVHSLETQSPNSQVTGIAFGDGGINVNNNMIHLGLDAAGNALTVGQTLIGLRNDCCSTFVVHNSVYIGGHGINGSGNSYAMSELPILTGIGIRRYSNNIFFNGRSNGFGTGKHYAFAAANSASPLTQSNGNVLAAQGAGGMVGRYNGVDYPSLQLWQTAFGQDLNSISANPNFIQPTGPASALNLHIVAPPQLTPIEAAGQASLSTNEDIDLGQRYLLTPVDIGADAGMFVSEPMLSTPEVALLGNGLGIMAGDSTPQSADFTYFGSGACGASPLGVFVILNTGIAPLTLGSFSISGSSAFVLTPPSVTTLSTGQSTSFTVAFSPTLNVPAQATVSFSTNDPDEGSYSFWVQGLLASDTTAPVALCQPSTLQLNSAGQAQLPPSLLDGGSTDNCAIATLLLSQEQFTCVDVGVRPVTLTVTDAAGNVATCTTLVTVLDTVAPVLTCADLTVTLPGSGAVVVTPAMVGTATDVCGIASYQLSQTQVACPNVGSSPLQLIAEDVHGNRDSCTVVLTTVTAPLAVVLTPPVATPCGDPIACAGQANVSATASASGSCTPYTYAWSNGQAGATATGLGTGTHSVTVTSANGQQQVQSILFTEPAPLTASIAATPSCLGSNAGSATASGAGGQSCQAYTYLWSNGATSASVTGLAPGGYQVTVTDAAGCTATASTTVSSWPSFSVVISQNLGNLVATPGFVTYQWYSSVGAITGATVGQFTPMVSGSYHVVATDSNGCSWTSAVFPFVYVGAAQALPGARDITLHPNPNTGRFQVLLPWPLQGPVTVKVTDLRGRSVYTETLDMLSSDHVFDLSSVAAGTYLMTLQAHDGLLYRLRFVRE